MAPICLEHRLLYQFVKNKNNRENPKNHQNLSFCESSSFSQFRSLKKVSAMTMDIAKKTLVDPHLKENLENLEIEVVQLNKPYNKF
jgi:hypothetical protein